MVLYIRILECKNKLYLIKSKTLIDNILFIFFFDRKKETKSSSLQIFEGRDSTKDEFLQPQKFDASPCPAPIPHRE